jgi:tyrosine-specific transport protein
MSSLGDRFLHEETAMKDTASPPVISLSLLIAGTATGAGLLGLPVKTGPAGLVPSLVVMLVVWASMTATGWIIARRLIDLKRPGLDLVTLFGLDLGPTGKWTCIFGYLIVFYGVMTAYLSAGESVLTHLFPGVLPARAWLILFFLGATSLTLLGTEVLRRGNAVLMVAGAAAFALLLFAGAGHVDAGRFAYRDWGFLFSTIPIMACGFAFQPVLPTVCRRLDFEAEPIRRALLIGTLIPLVASILWVVVVLGCVPVEGRGGVGLVGALKLGLPATEPLAAVTGSSMVLTAGAIFCFFALVTSYLGVSTGLLGFLADLAAPVIPRDRHAIHAMLAFVPPLATAFLFRNIFIEVLDIVGGAGVLLVFGILPSLALLRSPGRTGDGWKLACAVLLAFFILAMALELAQEGGMLRISPHGEYWKLP